MEINLTLIIQMLVFAAFVWFTMKFVWPPLTKAMEERQIKIADGLAAAERGHKELELAQCRIKDELKQAKACAAEIIDKATLRAAQMIEEAKKEARLTANRENKLAKEQLTLELNYAREQLHKEIGQLALACAQKILQQKIDAKTNQLILDKLIEEI